MCWYWRQQWRPKKNKRIIKSNIQSAKLNCMYSPLPVKVNTNKKQAHFKQDSVKTRMARAIRKLFIKKRNKTWAPKSRTANLRFKNVTLNAVNKHKTFTAFENRSSLKVQNLRHGRLHVLRWLLWEAAEMPALETRSSCGSSGGALALHYASARGCLDCVKLLIEASPDEHSANAQMENAVTPVYLAAQEGHLDVLRYLVLEAGGSLLMRAKDGMAPLHAAAQMGCLPCIKWMIQDQGIDPDLRDADGATALHFAASRGHTDTVRWLLRHGARLVLDKFGKSPLNDAAENEQIECLSVLVQHGTLPDYSDEDIRGKLSESSSLNSEPFFLHPPTSLPPTVPLDRGQSPRVGPEIYINPMATSPTSSASSECSFYLHDPKEVIYNRVKDLFEVTRASPDGSNTSSVVVSPTGAVTVRVDVHTSDVSDLSEPSAQENDYEDIYQAKQDANRSGTLVSIVQVKSNQSPPEPPKRNNSPEMHAPASPRHSLPPLQANNNTPDRALKRVVSEPGGLQCPAAPPPPPPPPVPSESPRLSTQIGPKATSDSACGGKHLVLPFVPPKFPSTDSDCLIKPSEYLRSISKPLTVSSPPAIAPVQEEVVIVTSTPLPPPPPPPAPPIAQQPKAQQQPLAAISIHDLSSVQLRKTDRLGKVLSAPPGPAPVCAAPQTNIGDTGFRSQKDDLIAELKRSRDISGIRKIRVERARSEERDDKLRFNKLSKQYSVDSFVEQIPELDSTGNPIPAWKRQMLAKKAAEKARKDAEERAQKEAEEERMKNIPAWKRQLLAQKGVIGDSKRSSGIYHTRILPDNNSNVTTLNNVTSSESMIMEEVTESMKQTTETSPVMPWRSQLRKTSSSLNLLE